MDIALLGVWSEYDAGNPKPLADYIRKFGLPKGQEFAQEFVASIVDGTYKRPNRRLLAGDRKLNTLRILTAHYKLEKKLAAEIIGYVPQYANMEAVYRDVAKHHKTSVEALKKLNQPNRRRAAGRKDKAGK